MVINHVENPNSSPRVRPLPGNQRSPNLTRSKPNMIRNTKCVHPHNLKGIEITDSTQHTKFKQPPQKTTRHPKCHHHIKRAFDMTLLWCHHIEQQNSLPDLNNEATSYIYIYIQTHKKERKPTNKIQMEVCCLNRHYLTWNRLVKGAMQCNPIPGWISSDLKWCGTRSDAATKDILAHITGPDLKWILGSCHMKILMERYSWDQMVALQVSELLQKGRMRGGTRSYNQANLQGIGMECDHDSGE